MNHVFRRKLGYFMTSNGKTYPAYSGNEEYKNNPLYESLKDHGPIPAGIWIMTEHYLSYENKGPNVIRLAPSDVVNTYGRTGFLIHGDSIENPGNASDGCIILPPIARLELIDSSIKFIEIS